jgi:hypothetical protein
MAYKIKSTLKRKSTKSKNKYTKKRGKIIKRKRRKTIKQKLRRRTKQKGGAVPPPLPPPRKIPTLKFENLNSVLDYNNKGEGEMDEVILNKQTIKLKLLINGEEKCAIQVFTGKYKKEDYTIIPNLIGHSHSSCKDITEPTYNKFKEPMKKLFEKLKQKFTTSFVLKEINENMKFNEAIFVEGTKTAEELNVLYGNLPTHNSSNANNNDEQNGRKCVPKENSGADVNFCAKTVGKDCGKEIFKNMCKWETIIK